MRTYAMTQRTESPVFVGDGNKINKKENLFMPAQRRVYVPDMAKIFRDFQKRRLIDAYEDYLLRDGRDFGVWLREKGVVAPRQIPEWCAYWVDSADAVFENRGRKEILTFIKDPYGCPYIPGSSAKGMLRTILLSSLILQNWENLSGEAHAVQRAELRGSRTRLLAREKGQLEQKLLYTLNRPGVFPSNKVNDMLSGLQVSDSRPLSMDALALCQKIDMGVDGERRRLPILRECLRPGTEVTFDLTILPEQFPFSPEDLLAAAERCRKNYDLCFWGAFPAWDVRRGGNAWLGGGCGYGTKTFAYPLLGGQGVKKVSQILDVTLP